jgi:hypothetical protein
LNCELGFDLSFFADYRNFFRKKFTNQHRKRVSFLPLESIKAATKWGNARQLSEEKKRPGGALSL